MPSAGMMLMMLSINSKCQTLPYVVPCLIVELQLVSVSGQLSLHIYTIRGIIVSYYILIDLIISNRTKTGYLKGCQLYTFDNKYINLQLHCITPVFLKVLRYNINKSAKTKLNSFSFLPISFRVLSKYHLLQ